MHIKRNIKKMKRIALLLIFASSSSLAVVDQKTGAGVATGRDSSVSLRSSSGTESSRTTTSKSNLTKGLDESDRKTVSDVWEQNFGVSLSTTLPISAIFFPAFANWEEKDGKDYSFFKECHLVSNPPTVSVELGMSIVSGPKSIDSVAADLNDKISKNQLPVKLRGNGYKAREIARCHLIYGAVAGRAAKFLIDDLRDIGGVEKNKNEPKISLVLEDVIALAESALWRSRKTLSRSENFIGKLYRKANLDVKNAECRFNGSPEQIGCGPLFFTIGYQSSSYLNGIKWWSEDQIGGIKQTVVINSGWTLKETISKLQETSKYKKISTDVEKSASDLEKTGKTKEAAQVRKKSLDSMMRGETSFNPLSFIK
jgi:hypothetical protein